MAEPSLSASNETIDESADEAPARPSLVLMRVKRLLIAPLLLIRRLRRARADEDIGAAAMAEPQNRPGRRGQLEESDAPPDAAPPLWRRALPYGLVLLAGGAAGGGAMYWLSARIVAHQSAELGAQADEISRLKGLLAGYDKLVLENNRKLESERGKRAELGNRLAIAQTDLARRPLPKNVGNPGVAERTAAGGQGADCTLRPGGGIGNTLKACLEEFNGQ